jgi:hypothetical protein
MGKKKSSKTKTVARKSSNTASTDKDIHMKQFARKISLSIKKRHKYGDFIRDYFPIEKIDDKLLARKIMHSNPTKMIGDNANFSIHPPMSLMYYATCDNAYDDICEQILLANELLIEKRLYGLKKSQILGWLVEDEVEKQNIKVYPNHYVFAFWIGGIFAAITFLFTTFLVTWALGYLCGAIYATIVTLLFSKTLKK